MGKFSFAGVYGNLAVMILKVAFWLSKFFSGKRMKILEGNPTRTLQSSEVMIYQGKSAETHGCKAHVDPLTVLTDVLDFE